MAASSDWKMLQMVAILVLIAASMQSECQVFHQGCRGKCGNVTIPYPFGLDEGCALNNNFTLVCNDTTPGGPKAFLPRSRGRLEIIDISLDGTLRKYTYVAKDCYAPTGVRSEYIESNSWLKPTGFYYSAAHNKLTAVGCDTTFRFAGIAHNQLYSSGCISMCYNESSVTDGSCNGIGCCQAANIPKQLSRFTAFLSSDNNHTFVKDFNPCSYAFIADSNYLKFTVGSLHENIPETVPTVVDWAVGDRNCSEAKDTPSYACIDPNSECQESDNGPGYRCFCKSGYTGNAYLNGGCLDVNECETSENNCMYKDKCYNTNGSYTCSCPKWFQGDGKRDGTRCTLDIRVLIGNFFDSMLLRN